MKSMRQVAARRGESGFALLLVFAMAATVALMFYLAVPRVAFEAQRNREEILVERGEQYKRAIQLYFRKFKTYPMSIEALENTNNVRFLRRRYPDPLTGKDDWRLIHIGPGGIFTDSLTNKPKGDKKQENLNNFISEAPSLASTGTTDQQVNAALRRRPSDGGQPPAGSDPNAPPQPPVAAPQPGTDQPPVDPANPQAVSPGQPMTSGGYPPSSGNYPPMTMPLGQPPGVSPTPVSGFPGVPGVPFSPGAQPGPVTSPDPAAQNGPTGNPSSFGQPGVDPSQGGSNQAADMIRKLLTGPRAMPGSQPTGTAGGSQISTGSIAGVASKVEKHGIKIYNEREKYNEWEFIYDFSKDRTGAGQLGGQMGAGDPRLGQQQPGQQITGTPGFGGQAGSSSSFGSDSGSQPQSPAPGTQPGPIPPPATPPQ